MSDDQFYLLRDRLFKTAFSDLETAAAFLNTHLPPFLSTGADWKNLNLESGRYIDEKFEESESDLLYKVPFNNREILLYLIFKHQSDEDEWLKFRGLKSMEFIWRKEWMKHGEDMKILPIIPIVLAQNETPWEMSPHFHDLIDVPKGMESVVLPMMPKVEFQFVQLAEMSMEAMTGTPTGIVALRLLKAELLNALLDDIVWDEELLSQVSSKMFRVSLSYICESPQVDKELFLKRIKNLRSPKLHAEFLSLVRQSPKEDT